MAAQRRSATKQRRRGTQTAPAGDAAAAAAVEPAAQVAEPKKQAVASSKSSAAKQTTSQQTQQVSKFRARWESLRKAFQKTVSEIKKVTWPDSETTRNLTALVIAMSVVLGLFLGGIDYLLLRLFEIF
jgi:preprotein translocase SecE subunit